MEKQIVNHILSADTLKSVPQQNKKKIQSELLKHFHVLTDTAKELGINIDDLWRAYILKREYNQCDTREKRHIMYTTNEEKAQLNQEERIKLQKDYSLTNSQIVVNGYDVTTKQNRQITQKDNPLAFFQNEDDIKTLSLMVPSYVKFTVLKCSNLYLVDIPRNCIEKFPGLLILLAPKKKTVMIGLDGYSPVIQIPNTIIYDLGQLRVAFIDADIAEEIDESNINKFWFYENYSPKRKYHFIYSNSRKESVKI